MRLAIALLTLAILIAGLTTATAQKVVIEAPEKVKVGETFTVSIYAQDVSDLAGFDIYLVFNSKVLEYKSYSLAPDVSKFSVNYAKEKKEDFVEFAALTLSPSTDAVSGDVRLLDITFKAIGAGQSKINFNVKSKLVKYANGKVDTYPGVDFGEASVLVTTGTTATTTTTASKVTTTATAATTTTTTQPAKQTKTAKTSVAATAAATPTATAIATTTTTATSPKTGEEEAVTNVEGGQTERTPGFEIALGIIALSLGIIAGRRKF